MISGACLEIAVVIFKIKMLFQDSKLKYKIEIKKTTRVCQKYFNFSAMTN